jgi:putative transposase
MRKFGTHSVYSINYHIVFCPKRRKAILCGDIVTDLTSIIYTVSRELGVVVEQVSIQPDHVHIFVVSTPRITPHTIVKRIKGTSSNILRKKYRQLLKLPALWSSSYYCGTIGHVSEDIVKKYIENQKGK